MTTPAPYLHFPGTAREALEHYHSVFGGDLVLHTFGEMGRCDGASDLIGHGVLSGPVDLFGADDPSLAAPAARHPIMLSLLGSAPSAVLRGWYDALAAAGTVDDALQQRPWGAWDGVVTDQFGITWLIGFEE